MTICIAALYDNGKGAVLASDQMITASIPIGYEFEHQEITKIVPLNDPASIYALTAGNVLLGTEILNIAKVQIQQQQHMVTASEAVETVRAVYGGVMLSTQRRPGRRYHQSPTFPATPTCAMYSVGVIGTARTGPDTCPKAARTSTRATSIGGYARCGQERL